VRLGDVQCDIRFDQASKTRHARNAASSATGTTQMGNLSMSKHLVEEGAKRNEHHSTTNNTYKEDGAFVLASVLTAFLTFVDFFC
jgi:hypothetical protein